MYIHLFSGTHWDREWYQTFQGFRFRLVKMTDKMIDALETEDYGVFHFDGQTVVLEDYLEIRPENRERLQKLIQSGKLMIGPWYCMPDEFLVSGESLIKNMKRGHKIARQFGVEPMKYGYICDIFGHIAQMPQILSQFGIHHALLGRGTNESTTPMHFCWEGLDGSKVATFKLKDSNGYGAFMAEVFEDERNLAGMAEEYDEMKRRIKEHTDYEINRANVPVVVLMDALDHLELHRETKTALKALRELYPDAVIRQDSILNMCEELKPYVDSLPVKKGELNESAKTRNTYLMLITNTLSSRYPLKKYNDMLQTVTEKITAPLYALGLVDIPYRYQDLADQYLLQNQPHDSICGCSIDAVHEDMIYRFHQAEEICEEITDEFRHSIQTSEETDNLVVKVYNPLPYRYHGGIKMRILFPKDYKTIYWEPFGYENLNSFRIFDANGTEIPYCVCDVTTNQTQRTYNQYSTEGDWYTVAFDAELIPMGITEFVIKPFTESSRYLAHMKQDERSAENEFVKLNIAADGSVSLFDKATGMQYTDILRLVDDGEIGDGWMHANPSNDLIVTDSVCSVRKLQSGPDRAVFEITQKLLVPEEMLFEKRGIRRSEKTVELVLRHQLTLQKSARFVEIQTCVDNNAKDHRVRLKIASGIEGETYYANQTFGFVKRKTGANPATQTWHECEVPEKQTSGIVLKKNEKGGLAFLSAYGLHECAVHDNGDMYITLYRCFRKTIHKNGEPGGQLLENLEFKYRIAPVNTATSFAELQRMQDEMQAGFVMTQCSKTEAEKNPSLMEVSGDGVVYSTANVCEGGMEIRLYQDSDAAGKAKIRLHTAPKSACAVDLEGNVLEELSVSGGAVEAALKPWEIKTVRITL